MTTANPIPVPEVDSDVPVAVIPVASVAPLDGPPDGERINVFTVAPKAGASDLAGRLLEDLRERVLASPFACVAVAFTLGYFMARVRR